MQTMQQKRAKYALQQVQKAANDNRTNHSEYKSYASGLPAMIHMNGLGQAAAFYRSKGGTHKQIYDLLSNWLCTNDKEINDLPLFQDHDNLLSGITLSDIHQYQLAQAEAQALMDWVKKFAKAYMIDDIKEK